MAIHVSQWPTVLIGIEGCRYSLLVRSPKGQNGGIRDRGNPVNKLKKHGEFRWRPVPQNTARQNRPRRFHARNHTRHQTYRLLRYARCKGYESDWGRRVVWVVFTIRTMIPF